jgi:hypothetical protein
MTKKSDGLALLGELNRERDELEAAIEAMIADMAEAEPEARQNGDWAPNGASTRRYIELTNRQAEVENDIADLSRAITAAAKPATPH